MIRLPSSRLWSVASGWLPATIASMPTRRELAEWSSLPPLPPSYTIAAHGVAVVRLSGVLVRRQSAWSRYLDGSAIDLAVESVARAMADARVKAVVVNVADCPGGERGVVDDFDLAMVTRSKPVVAYLAGDVHAEGYAVACCCDEIHAHPEARVGSLVAHEAVDSLSLVFDAAPMAVGFDVFYRELERRVGREALQAEQDRCEALQLADDLECVFEARGARARFIQDRRAHAMSIVGTNALSGLWNGPPIDAEGMLRHGLADDIESYDDALWSASWSATT